VFLIAGLVTSLFVVRRRVWVRVVDGPDGQVLEIGALARGDDPGLPGVVDDIAQAFTKKASPKVEL
jgi:cytochrome c biogenesis protein